MHLTVLGTGTVAPSATRTAAAYWVRSGPVRLLLDCGPGTLHRAAQFDIPWPDVTHVAVTHFHLDHWLEVPMVLYALRWGVEPARSRPLEIVGPVGLRDRLEHLARGYSESLLEPGYPLAVTELEPGDTHRLADDVELETCKTPHTEESIAYAVRDSQARLVYTGDMGPSDALGDWARGCDLLLSECSLPDDRAIAMHLTPTQAGRLAARAQPHRLVLTHLYPPVEQVDVLGLVAAEFAGKVVVAEDGDRFTVGA
ncbi:MAG: ribonuclease Z [Gemmatimonadetes bacterium]|nr:ribonuclease Z [Gemmatimonadota bacterium]